MLILHGDNEILSRQKYLDAKSRAIKSGLQPVEFSGSSLTVSDLVSAVETSSLFGPVHAVFITDFFSRRPSNEKKEIINYLKKSFSPEVFIWESKDVSAQLKDFPVSAVFKFDLPKYVFKYLDDLDINSLQSALSVTAPEQILALLAGHIRKLLIVRGNAGDFPSWQLAKLKSRAFKYSLADLIRLQSDLLAVDYGLKTSSLPYSASSALELWTLSAVR